MAKIAQLIEAGDYLVYKGDWNTDIDYNVNDIVTWNTDGHLYEVIKAHTSSISIKPNNTEYYKAMTSTKLQENSFYVSNEIGTNAFVDYVRTHEADIAFITDNDGIIYKDIRDYKDGFVSMSKIYVTYNASGSIDKTVILTILAKANNTNPIKRFYTLNNDGTITAGDNGNVTGTFTVYSY